MPIKNYEYDFNRIKSLQPFALVTSGGRSGTDFLQSLLDSHEEVLIFSGTIKLYIDFFEKSKCMKSKSIDIEDIAHEFVGVNIEKFKSKYDYIERKDQLGEDHNDSLNIEPQKFIRHFVSFLKNQDITKKNILLGIHAAYYESLGLNLKNLNIFIYHAHHFDEVYKFMEDFSTAIILCTTRDPRAGLVSSIENWRKYSNMSEYSSKFMYDNYFFFYFHLKRITETEGRLVFSKDDHIIVRLEDLLNTSYMNVLSNLLKISFHESMLISTFGGKLWFGDRVSGEKNQKSKWTANRTYNRWDEKLSWREKYIINYFMISKLQRNKYVFTPITFYGYFLVLFFALIPFKYELRYFTPKYLSSVFKINRTYGFYYLLFLPLNFIKVRILIIKFATIQLLNKYNVQKSPFIP